MKNKISYPKSFTSKKYPEFIRNSIFFDRYPRPTKVFPRIGLKNCQVPVSSITKSKYWSLVSLMGSFIDILYPFTNNLSVLCEQLIDEDKTFIAMKIQDIRTDCLNLDALINGEAATKNNLLNSIKIDKNGIPYASLPKGIALFSEVKFNPRRDLIDIFKQIQKQTSDVFFSFGNKTQLKTKYPFIFNFLQIGTKTKVKKLFKNDTLKICFSSDCQMGYWDIATMSMRGITSCMRWNSDHSKSLIGSILDPYVGIIYLTDNTHTKYGNRMLARAVVRYIIDVRAKKPGILIERIYTNASYTDISDDILAIFRIFIEQKTQHKIKVISSYDDGIWNYHYIPLTKPIEDIFETANERFDANTDEYYPKAISYRDSEILYSRKNKFYNSNKISL